MVEEDFDGNGCETVQNQRFSNFEISGSEMVQNRGFSDISEKINEQLREMGKICFLLLGVTCMQGQEPGGACDACNFVGPKKKRSSEILCSN